MELGARMLERTLYLLLFAVPLTAIAGAWLEGHPLTFLAGLEIASPIAPSHDTGESIARLHTWLGDTLLWLAGLHALAAIVHHVRLKDSVPLVRFPPPVLPGPPLHARPTSPP